jgi:hypothetical protein
VYTVAERRADISTWRDGAALETRARVLLETQYYGCCVVDFYDQWRTHLSLDQDAPLGRAIETPSGPPIAAVPHVGGLHHHYERLAA